MPAHPAAYISDLAELRQRRERANEVYLRDRAYVVDRNVKARKPARRICIRLRCDHSDDDIGLTRHKLHEIDKARDSDSPPGRCIVVWSGRVLPGVLFHGELAKDDDVAKQGCRD